MKIEIVNRSLVGDRETRARTARKVRSVLNRLSRHVDRVIVKVEALAGRAGLRSRECLVLIQMRGGGQVLVRKRGEGVVGLVFSALRQARGAVVRRLSRRKVR